MLLKIRGSDCGEKPHKGRSDFSLRPSVVLWNLNRPNRLVLFILATYTDKVNILPLSTSCIQTFL